MWWAEPTAPRVVEIRRVGSAHSKTNHKWDLAVNKITLLFASLFFAAPALSAPPRLVLQITVDGLRADLLERYQENSVKDGFNMNRRYQA